MVEGFFGTLSDSSAVKAEIVAKYFFAWANVMAANARRLAYIDLYAGPGRYETGEKSTPLRVLEEAIANPRIGSRLVSLFNDQDPSAVASLEAEIAALEGIETLAAPPQVRVGQVDEELVEQFQKTSMIPSLSFIDPWGYKGLSLKLIQAVIKDWGSEAVFFFNYNRINMGVNNSLVEAHMEALFGSETLETLQAELLRKSPQEREARIRRALGESLSAMGAKYLIPFRFNRAEDERTSHYICFVSKNILGYTIMKDVMASAGIRDADGVPKFEYFPQTHDRQMKMDMERPLLALPEELRRTFAGRALTFKKMVLAHTVGTPFQDRHYRQAILELEEQGKVTCSRAASQRKKGTLAADIVITFPG